MKPTIVPISLAANAEQVYARLQQRHGCVLLQSGKSIPGLSNWSWVSGPALATLYTPAHQATTLTRHHDQRLLGRWADPFTAIHDILQSIQQPPQTIPFTGGLIGYLGYDLARHIETLPTLAIQDPPWPWLQLHLCDHLLAYHHASAQWYFCTQYWPQWSTPERTKVFAQTWLDACNTDATDATNVFTCGTLITRTKPDRYKAQVSQILAYIAAGDIFQANLSHRLEAPFSGNPFTMYRHLALANPAPFSAYLQSPDFALASTSPERFLSATPDGRVTARPIKGTLARHPNPTVDQAHRTELAHSEKDRAENLMIVDLMRNDLGRVAQTGSVHVEKLFELEAHPSVWQMVSTITAQLKPEHSAADLLRACWPPGSMTGAPKIRAMQIIDSLEPVQRGPYAGAIGYLDAAGGMDLSVTIRTTMVYQNRVMLQLGGAIVADSSPSLELEETLAKGRLLTQALNPAPNLAPPCSEKS